MPKISIVIPVYNNAQYLDECLISVINQTEKDIEIICIDDKSTDNSLEILNNYAKKDNRIKVLTLLKNQGVSNARNIGLKVITGEYVCFLDSDDFFETDYCKLLLENIIKFKTDLACGGHCKVNIQERKISKWLPNKLISKNGIDDILLFTKHRNVTQKLFKTSIIKAHDINFNTDLHYMEDALFLITYLTHCNSISGVQESLYNVRINQKSLCRNTEYIQRREIESTKAKEYINNIIKEYKNHYKS